MENPLDRFDRAVAASRKVLAQVQPADLDAQSPCASWTNREVVNHLIGANDFFVGNMGGTPSAPAGTDFASGDFLKSFDAAAEAARAAFGAPGALDQTVQLPWGPTPAAAVVGMAATDCFTHGWDLAKGTGQSTDLDPELAEALLDGAKTSIQDAFRGPDGSGAPFGPQQEAGADATAADRLAAFLGRTI